MNALRFTLTVFSLLALGACGTSEGVRYEAQQGESFGEVVVAGLPLEAARAGDPRDPEADRKLVRDAILTVEVGSDDAVAPALEQARVLTEATGGYVSWEGPGTMTLRIPDARLDETLDRLGELGDVERREVSVRDVTASFTDLQIRLDNARALQARLRALLDRAETVADVLAVERELARVTVEVESLEGQMRLLQNQVAYSTVRLEVYDGATPGPLGWVFVGAYEVVKWLFVWE